MDVKQGHLRTRAEPYYASLDQTSSSRKTLRRRAKVIIIALGVAGLAVGLHTAKFLLHAPNSSSHHAAPKFDWYALKPSTEIKWTPCYDGQQCARLLLPLDYFNPDGPTTAIALRMIPAASRGTPSYRGTVLINPGGPGEAGTNLVARSGANISAIVGDSFDVLGFDPRGTGASTPHADCFGGPSRKAIWQTQSGHQLLNASDAGTVGLYRARQQVLAQRCEERIGGEEGIARFMSTPSVARDMLEITHKMGQEKLHYWGFSYGSILGQYFAAMYPDKVGRVVIDGVYDAHNYRGALWSSNLLDVEAVIDSLFAYCHQAGPLKCGLYEPTPDKVRARFFRVLDSVAHTPVPIALANPPLVVTRTALLEQLFEASYNPLTSFGTVADTILALEASNQTALAALAPKIVKPTECECAAQEEPWPLRAENDAFTAIACGDGDVRPFDLEEYKTYYDALVQDSPLAGPIWSVHYLQCAEWRVRPKWRYTSPLSSNATAHPLLLVSPRWDPVCPLRDARVVRARYKGAGLLVQNSHGHCSLSAPSVCTAKYVRAYMEHGTLPEEGAVCEPDEVPFVGSLRDVGAMSVEDRGLLEAIGGLANEVPMFGATY